MSVLLTGAWCLWLKGRVYVRECCGRRSVDSWGFIEAGVLGEWMSGSLGREFGIEVPSIYWMQYNRNISCLLRL